MGTGVAWTGGALRVLHLLDRRSRQSYQRTRRSEGKQSHFMGRLKHFVQSCFCMITNLHCHIQHPPPQKNPSTEDQHMLVMF